MDESTLLDSSRKSARDFCQANAVIEEQNLRKSLNKDTSTQIDFTCESEDIFGSNTKQERGGQTIKSDKNTPGSLVTDKNNVGSIDERPEKNVVPTPEEGQPGIKPPPIAHNYAHAFQLTPLFFAANQMGQLTDRRLPWRQDTAIDGIYSGGYSDAGDNIMFGKPQFAAIAYMCLTADIFKLELEELGQLDEIKQQILHGTDFILNGHQISTSGETQSLVGQLSDSPTDHPKWLTLEEISHPRPVYVIDVDNPASDYAGLAAAALGFCSRIFTDEYQSELRMRSLSLLSFSFNYRGLGESAGNINTVYKNYNGDEDELAFAALGAFRATDDPVYLYQAVSILDDSYLGPWAGIIDHHEHVVFNLLAYWNNDFQRRNILRLYMNNWKYVGSELKKTQGGYVVHDSNNWGSTGSIAPALFNMAVYAKLTGDNSWDNHMKSQIDYLLGSNPRNLSYLCGYGPKNCSRVHHRGASGGSSHNGGPNKHMLWGAILGGVTENDYDFVNSHSNWTGNEPPIGYNSQMQAPLLYMYSKFGGEPLADEALQSLLENWEGY